jgi:hypothetical protein
VIVIWRFTGARAVSETAELRAQRGVAVSFWLLAPYIAAQSAWDLADGHRAGASAAGIALTAAARWGGCAGAGGGGAALAGTRR